MRSFEVENDSGTVLAPDAGKGLGLDAHALSLPDAAPVISPICVQTDGDLMHALALQKSTLSEWPFPQTSHKKAIATPLPLARPIEELERIDSSSTAYSTSPSTQSDVTLFSPSEDPQPTLYSLTELSALILTNTALAQSIIVAFRCFSQIHLGIVHRFVVLELSSEVPTHKWLRFDRRPSRTVNVARIVTMGAPANDSTIFGSTIRDVLGEGKTSLECHFKLKKSIALEALVPFFSIFSQTNPRYRFWKENCWFLSSLIAGLLVRIGNGTFEYGHLVYPNIALELRRYLFLRYLVETNASLESLTEVEQVESLLIKYHPSKAGSSALIELKTGALVHEATLTIAGMSVSGLKERYSAYSNRFLRDLLRLRPSHSRKSVALAKMLAAVSGDAFMDDLHSTARSASVEAITILRSLLSRSSLMDVIRSMPIIGSRKLHNKSSKNKESIADDENIVHEDDDLLVALSESYNALGDAQRALEQWEMAERAYEGGVRALRVLSSRHPHDYVKQLCLQLSNLAMTQVMNNKLAEAAVSRHESLSLRREVCVDSLASRGRELTNRSLGPMPPPGLGSKSYFEDCLKFCKMLYREARGVHFVDQECIRIRRMLHQDNDMVHREHLARTLLAHAKSLRHIFVAHVSTSSSSASAPQASSGSEYHTVMEPEEPLLEIEDLVRSLNQQGWNLAALGRYHQAAEAFGESVRISHALQARDPSGVGAQNLPYSLCAWGDCLYSSGRPAEAVVAIGESVELGKRSHAGSGFLANLMASYCRALRTAGDLAKAIEIGTESSALWDRVFEANPTASYGTKIAFSNFALTNALIRRKEPVRALVVAKKAVADLARLMEVPLEVPQRLEDLPMFVKTATQGKSLPGSQWVVANMQGELDDLVTAVSRI